MNTELYDIVGLQHSLIALMDSSIAKIREDISSAASAAENEQYTAMALYIGQLNNEINDLQELWKSVKK